jgi:ribonuclease HI
MAKNVKTKYYVVWTGANPGIYRTWEECAAQVRGFPKARYKAFPTLREAEAAFRRGEPAANRTPRKRSEVTLRKPAAGIIHESISVDAACSGNPGVMEYRGVQTATGAELFHRGPFPVGTNNIGEFLAIVHALALLHKRKDRTTPVYTDSRTALGWVLKGKARTKLAHNAQTEQLHELILRAETWLNAHRWNNPLLKWETDHWGEIPEDFGRK